jgi:hypothetical protein
MTCTVRSSVAAAIVVLSVLVCVCVASAADIGANDDTGKYAADGGAVFFAQMEALGLRQTVLTTRFQPSKPTVIPDEEALDRALPIAVAAGLRVSLAVYPYPPSQLEHALTAPADFAAFLTVLARRYPDVKQFVVLNEPNQPAFLRPQFDAAGRIVSAATAGRFLARAYDALKAVDPSIEVIGLGLSPRGNDRPTAPANVSTSPVRFLQALGRWYRASGRRAPLMDGLSFHPYPNRATDPLARGYEWPDAGFTNLARIKQAFWDAFHGTRQRTTANGLKLYLDEVGWQVDTSRRSGYTGVENVPVTTEAKQAAIYGELVKEAQCDDDIAEVNIFGFYDNSVRNTGFQAGLNRTDGSPRPSAAAVAHAISDGPFTCDVQPPWRPSSVVVGAYGPALRVGRTATTVGIAADEGADVVACLLPGWLTPAQARSAVRARRASSPGCDGGKTLPSRPAQLRFVRTPTGLPTTLAVRLSAEANAARTMVFSQTLG